MGLVWELHALGYARAPATEQYFPVMLLTFTILKKSRSILLVFLSLFVGTFV